MRDELRLFIAGGVARRGVSRKVCRVWGSKFGFYSKSVNPQSHQQVSLFGSTEAQVNVFMLRKSKNMWLSRVSRSRLSGQHKTPNDCARCDNASNSTSSAILGPQTAGCEELPLSKWKQSPEVKSVYSAAESLPKPSQVASNVLWNLGFSYTR